MSIVRSILSDYRLSNGLWWIFQPSSPAIRMTSQPSAIAYGSETASGQIAAYDSAVIASPGVRATHFNAGFNQDGSYTLNGLNSISDSMTIACWIKCSTNPPTDAHKTGFPFHATYHTAIGSASHYTYTDATIYCNSFRDDRLTITPSSSVDRTTWHLLTVTTSPVTNGWRLYQNSILVHSATGDAVGTLRPMYLGKSRDENALVTYNFHGAVAYWACWRRPFSNCDVAELWRISRNYQFGFDDGFPYYLVGEAAAAATFQPAWASQRSRLLTGGQV